MRAILVSFCFAEEIHVRIIFFALAGNLSKFALAFFALPKASFRSFGISSASIASSLFHEPSHLASSIF